MPPGWFPDSHVPRPTHFRRRNRHAPFAAPGELSAHQSNTIANLGNEPAIGHTFDLEFNVHNRSAGSAHPADLIAVVFLVLAG
jgi:hypothetical protein